MKPVLLILIVVWSGNVWPSTATAAPHSTLKVISWNIRFNNPGDGPNAWPNRKDWVAETIAEQKADVVGLQEVLIDQLEDLKARLPEFAVYGVGRNDGKSSGEFAPIFYRKERLELLDQGTFWLSRSPETVGSRDWDAAITRIASWVKLKDRRTQKVFFAINTHFDHRGSEARARSAELLVKMLGTKFAAHPVLLTGDFNTTPGSEPYNTLTPENAGDRAGFRDAFEVSSKTPEGPETTWNGFQAIVPNRRIDFVFVTESVQVLRHEILAEQRDGQFASDHLAVVADVTLGS